MDYGGEGGFMNENVVQIIPQHQESSVLESWMPALSDQAIRATEDDRIVRNADASMDNLSKSNYDGRLSQTRSDSEPPNKRSRNFQGGDSQLSGFRDHGLMSSRSRSRAIGEMFFKMKLCYKFRNRTCPYITDCNFAHGIEELRKPCSNWQEIMAARDDDHGVPLEPREEHQIPCLSTFDLGVENQRSYKRHRCRKFHSEEGCAYGDDCIFLHDEESEARESVAICLGPISGSGSTQKPSNWKTRICNKWEVKGYCPFRSKCCFAHGSGELHRYGGGLVVMDGRDGTSAPSDLKHLGISSKMPVDTVVASPTSPPRNSVYHMGFASQSQRSPGLNPMQGLRPIKKWKGSGKISKIYGDWIDDVELDASR